MRAVVDECYAGVLNPEILNILEVFLHAPMVSGHYWARYFILCVTSQPKTLEVTRY